MLKPDHASIHNVRANFANSKIEQIFWECPANSTFEELLHHCKDLAKEAKEKNGIFLEILQFIILYCLEAKTPRILAFVETCYRADVCAQFLRNGGVDALSMNRLVFATIHTHIYPLLFSYWQQWQREKVLEKLRKLQISVVVCTDVCARGLDIKELDYVTVSIRFYISSTPF